MVRDERKPRVAVCVNSFLAPSCTFIYRQLIGINEAFEAMVLTQQRMHEDLFPFEAVFAKRRARGSFFAGVVRRKLCLAGNLYEAGPNQLRFWEQVIKEHRPALIHAQFGPAGLSIVGLARRLRIPLIVTFRGRDASEMFRRRDYLQSLPYLFDYAMMLTVSEHLRERLIAQGAPPERVVRHFNGIPTESLEPQRRTPALEKLRDGKQVVLLQAANFVAKKGHKYTLEAFAAIQRQYPKVRLVLIGDGPLRSGCEKACKRLGISEHVSFLGHLPAKLVAKHLTQADVFVHHSVTTERGDQEGIPNAVLEAMATGLPVVTTLHAGIPEVVEHDHTGYLVPERDVRAYELAIERALHDMRPIGENAARFVQSHVDLRRQNNILCDIYNRTIAGSNVRKRSA